MVWLCAVFLSASEIVSYVSRIVETFVYRQLADSVRRSCLPVLSKSCVEYCASSCLIAREIAGWDMYSFFAAFVMLCCS